MGNTGGVIVRTGAEVLARWGTAELAPVPISRKPDTLEPAVVDALRHLWRVAVSQDIVFELDTGDGLYEASLADPDRFVSIATSGTGDAWLMDTTSGTIWFFDHDGAWRRDCLTSLGIGFWDFLTVADLWQQAEDAAVPGPLPDPAKTELTDTFARIAPGFPAAWPYRFF